MRQTLLLLFLFLLGIVGGMLMERETAWSDWLLALMGVLTGDLANISLPAKEQPLDFALTRLLPLVPKSTRDRFLVPPDLLQHAPYELRIRSELLHNLAVRTTTVTQGRIPTNIEAMGVIGYDEERTSRLYVRNRGWVERLLVKAEGEKVNKGQLLCELFSSELVSVQEELIRALTSGDKVLLRDSRDRLMRLGIPKNQIRQLERVRGTQHYLRILAPQSGVISFLNVHQGMLLEPGKALMTLVDLRRVWLSIKLSASQQGEVHQGQVVKVRLLHGGNRVWTGQVNRIHPYLDADTHSLRVGVRLDNLDYQLKPNEQVRVTLLQKEKEGLRIPQTALLPNNSGYAVIVALGEGRFRKRAVTVGRADGTWVLIQNGLQKGEKVVYSAQYLLDEALRLQEIMAAVAKGE